MIQDLNDYAVFGRKHQKLFDVIGYDKSNFDRAAQLSREMDELLPLATLDKSNSPERIRRNKAFCLTKNLIDELLMHGHDTSSMKIKVWHLSFIYGHHAKKL